MKINCRALALAAVLAFSMLSSQPLQAANPIAKAIKEIIIKVIKAIDIVVQKLQNKTIWLQNAQKELENILSKMKLKEIGEWTEKQKEQYRKYYEELSKVKQLISNYQRVKDILSKQKELVREYGRVWGLLKNDTNFSGEEIEFMSSVYEGILKQSLKNTDHIGLVIKALTTQMGDAHRLEIINRAADQVQSNYDDLKLFNRQNISLSMQRANSEDQVQKLKLLYGME